MNTDSAELLDRLRKAKYGLKLLLLAWARFEDKHPDSKHKAAVQDVRVYWGKMAWEFMRE